MKIDKDFVMPRRHHKHKNGNNPFLQYFFNMTSWIPHFSKTRGSLIFMSKDIKHLYVQRCQVSSHLSNDFMKGVPTPPKYIWNKDPSLFKANRGPKSNEPK